MRCSFGSVKSEAKKKRENKFGENLNPQLDQIKCLLALKLESDCGAYSSTQRHARHLHMKDVANTGRGLGKDVISSCFSYLRAEQ